MKNFDVVGVGHSCLDKICLIDSYPSEDGSAHIKKTYSDGGGAVATALSCLSKLGVSSTFIGNMGFDDSANTILSLFHSCAVDTTFLEKRKDCITLESIVMVNIQTGSRTKFPYSDDNAPIVWTNDKIESVERAKILHIDGTNYTNSYIASTFAKKNNVKVSLDGCHTEKDNKKNLKLLENVDILITNSSYPGKVTGINDIDKALLSLSSLGPEIVVTTLGEMGSKAVIDGKVVSFPSYKVDVLDTTGAGDVFHGAFLYAYLNGMNTKESIYFSSVVSALKCQNYGGRSGIPTLDEAIKIYKNFYRGEKL